MEDIVYVVDENDEPIHKIPLSICHAENMLHRGAIILIYRNEKEIFMRQRPDDAANEQGLWEFPSVHPTIDYAYLEAVMKELEENLFVDMKMPDLVVKEVFKARVFSGHCYMFAKVFRIDYKGQFQINTKSAKSARFMDLSELRKDAYENPEQYSNIAKQLLKEYMKR